MAFDPALHVQDYQVFGEFGGVNPSISDSATYTFLSINKMEQVFHEEVQGCYLYSRHTNPSVSNLGTALAEMEGCESGHVTASGMSAIACALLQICSAGDEIVSSRTIYGGSYALMKNFLPKFGLKTNFVSITDLEDVEARITEKTKVIYCETISNPLLEVADLPALRKLADKYGCKLVVDNTFSPLIYSPYKLGAHVVVYSLTKFVNGMNDTIAGAVTADHDFISSMKSVNDGAAMLLGPTIDSLRAAGILKNLRTLHIRMKQHSANAEKVAKSIKSEGIPVFYPGLENHPQHELMSKTMNPEFGYGGMLTIDAKDHDTAGKLMIEMQKEKVGYFAVSLGFYKTLFSSPGSSTSSEIPPEEQIEMGMTDGLVRMSVGLDNNIDKTIERIKTCMKNVMLI